MLVCFFRRGLEFSAQYALRLSIWRACFFRHDLSFARYVLRLSILLVCFFRRGLEFSAQYALRLSKWRACFFRHSLSFAQYALRLSKWRACFFWHSLSFAQYALRLSIWLACPLCAHTSFSERLLLSPAEKIYLPLPANHKVHIGDKSLVSVQMEGGRLSLLARKEGKTLIVAGSKRYEMLIFNKGKKLQAKKLQKILEGFWGLRWSVSDSGAFQVTGRLNRLYDWAVLAQASQAFNIPYEFKALPGEGLKEPIEHFFKSRIQNRPPPAIAWRQLPLAYIPQGADLLEYQNLLSPFGLKPQEDPLWLFPAPFIEIEVAVAEELSSSGLSFGGEKNSENALSQYSSLLGFLNFLKQSGRGRALHHSSIIGQSGQKLEIQSGGQIPFASYNLKTEQSSVQWKSHGLRLNITPRLGKNRHIELTVKAQISEPLAFASPSSPPLLKTQSLENKVILKDGRILKLFQLQKKSRGGYKQGQLGSLLSAPLSFITGNNEYSMAQFVFIQARIQKGKQEAVSLRSGHSPKAGGNVRSGYSSKIGGAGYFPQPLDKTRGF